MFRIRGYPMLEGSLWPEGSDRNSPAEKDGRVMELWSHGGHRRKDLAKFQVQKKQETHLSLIGALMMAANGMNGMNGMRERAFSLMTMVIVIVIRGVAIIVMMRRTVMVCEPWSWPLEIPKMRFPAKGSLKLGVLIGFPAKSCSTPG